MKIVTKRLVLREFHEEDKISLIGNVNNLNVARFIANIPHPYGKSEAEEFIEYAIKEREKIPRINYELAINLKSHLNEEVIGAVAILRTDRDNRSAEISYWLGESYWRQKIMLEAASAILGFAFDDLNLETMILKAVVENKASNELAKRLGFKHIITIPNGGKSKSTGMIHDKNVYTLSKKDWKIPKDVLEYLDYRF